MLSSTRQLKLGQPLRLANLSDRVTYPSEVSSNLQDALGVETPETTTGQQVNWRPGTRVRASFVLEGERVFSFDTKVVGYNIVRGVPTVFLEHAENLRQTQKRRSPRIEFDRPAYFYPVQIINEGRGRRAERRAVVDRNHRHFGRIEDISAGGCAIRCQTPLQSGALLKIDFETDDDTPISVFGKVRHTEPLPPRMGIMHIMFTRISRRHLNQIQAYVYGLANAE
jgi:c-di-GMP-binding flagellar brake protein YcgR